MQTYPISTPPSLDVTLTTAEYVVTAHVTPDIAGQFSGSLRLYATQNGLAGELLDEQHVQGLGHDMALHTIREYINIIQYRLQADPATE